MNKQEFLNKLRSLLSGIPEKDVERCIAFYGEMIDDSVSEEKITEEEAVSRIGDVNKVASQIIVETPVYKIAKEKIKSSGGLKLWVILALIFGSPVWLSILITVFAVIFSVYISLWAVIISLWSVFASILASGLAVIAFGFLNLFSGNPIEGFAIIGAGITAVGLSIFAFFGCRAVTKGFVWLTKLIVLKVKNSLRNKEAAK